MAPVMIITWNDIAPVFRRWGMMKFEIIADCNLMSQSHVIHTIGHSHNVFQVDEPWWRSCQTEANTPTVLILLWETTSKHRLKVNKKLTHFYSSPSSLTCNYLHKYYHCVFSNYQHFFFRSKCPTTLLFSMLGLFLGFLVSVLHHPVHELLSRPSTSSLPSIIPSIISLCRELPLRMCPIRFTNTGFDYYLNIDPLQS